jgi:ribosomal protein L11 methylase PrmA
MVPDTFADELTSMFVRPGDRVLDPFCGSGRLLLSGAERGASCVGLDVNPLAILIVVAKLTSTQPRILEQGLRDLESASKQRYKVTSYDLEPNRRVSWFSSEAKSELWEILDFLNHGFSQTSLLPLAAVTLSATVRDVS